MTLCNVLVDKKQILVVNIIKPSNNRRYFQKPFYQFGYDVQVTELGEAILRCLRLPKNNSTDVSEGEEIEFLKLARKKSIGGIYKSFGYMDAVFVEEEVKFKPWEPYSSGHICRVSQFRASTLDPALLGDMAKRQCGHCISHTGRFFPHQDENEKNVLKDLFSDLDNSGFFRYCYDEDIDLVKKVAYGTGFLYESPLLRCHCGAMDFIYRSIAVFLKKEVGKTLEKILGRRLTFDQEREPKQTLQVDGIDYLLCTEQELTRHDYSEIIKRRLFGLLNFMLIEAGSKERVYEILKDESCSFVFLTPKMFDLICASPAVPDREKPREVEGEMPEIINTTATR